MPGRAFGWNWLYDNETVATIQVKTESDRIILSYRHRNSGGDWKNEEYPVQLEWTPCTLYGGRRAWFICPARGCGKRVAILYGGGIFACRHCYRLAYPSQREGTHDRAMRQADKIRARLGAGNFEWYGRKAEGNASANLTAATVRARWLCRSVARGHDAFVGNLRPEMIGVIVIAESVSQNSDFGWDQGSIEIRGEISIWQICYPENEKGRMGFRPSLSNLLNLLVGVRGFEPPTTCTPYRCATRLRYTPKNIYDIWFLLSREPKVSSLTTYQFLIASHFSTRWNPLGKGFPRRPRLPR